MKNLIVLLLLLLSQSVFSQVAESTNLNLSIGYKAAEIGFTNTLESEIIVGSCFSLTNSKVIQDRANKVDTGNYLHKMNNDYTPTVFVLMGANFDRFNMVGKIGACYINQNICKINDSRQKERVFIEDTKHLYLSIGVELMYQITDNFGVSGGFDNVNSLMMGINFKIN